MRPFLVRAGWRRARGVSPDLGDPNAVGVLVALVAAAAAAAFAVAADEALTQAAANPAALASLVVLTLILQLTGVEIYSRGSISVAGIGLLAVGFLFGAGPAMAAGILAALLHGVRTRSALHRIVFNVATFVLAAGAAAGLYHLVLRVDWAASGRLIPAFLAGAVFWTVNVVLLSSAMSLSEGTTVRAVWRERFRWLTPHCLAFGPLALASTVAYEKVGTAGLLAFALPPALMTFSVRQYLARTRKAVEEVRQANEELRQANAQLAARNDDLRDLFDFAGGLAARAHDRGELIRYAQDKLSQLTGVSARIVMESHGGIGLHAGGERVASLQLDGADERAGRWQRLREAVLPHLATAIESCELVDRVRKTHLSTIAALSRSMEAKDYYTGGHTERVSAVAVALARRLGYSGTDLDAIEIGALLHDIGKIGIPERILHKPGPLDAEEWETMKEHPVISDYILSETDLPPIVRQMARSSHERIDGHGYPDGLDGDEIPLPARIALVADAWDALTSDRPYRAGRHTEAALAEMLAHTGTQFCPQVMAALEDVHRTEPHLLSGARLTRVA